MTTPLAAWLNIASDPASSPQELERLANEIILVSSPDYERPSSGVEFLQTIGFMGILGPLLDRSLTHERGLPDTIMLGDVVVALVENPNTPHHILLRYAGDYPEAFLNNPVLLLLLLEHPDLFRQMDERRLLQFLQHANVPADLMGTMHSYASPTVLETLSLHIANAGEADDYWRDHADTLLQQLPITGDVDSESLHEHLDLETLPNWMVERLRQHESASIRAMFQTFKHDDLPILPIHAEPIEQAQLADADLATRLHAAHGSDPAILVMLSDDESAQVRAIIAQNPQTLASQFNLLEMDDVQSVRHGLALNPNLTPDIMLKLAKDYTWGALKMRLALVRHPQLSADALAILALDQAAQVRAWVARHPNVSPETRNVALEQALTRAVYSSDLFLHVAAALHEATPPQHLHKIIYSPYWQARYALSLNPSATEHELHFLSNDGNRWVRAASRSRLEARG